MNRVGPFKGENIDENSLLSINKYTINLINLYV